MRVISRNRKIKLSMANFNNRIRYKLKKIPRCARNDKTLNSELRTPDSELNSFPTKNFNRNDINDDPP